MKEGKIASWPVRVIIGAGKISWDFNVYVVFNMRGSNPNDLTTVLAAAHFGCWETSFEPEGWRFERSASSHKRHAVQDVPR